MAAEIKPLEFEKSTSNIFNYTVIGFVVLLAFTVVGYETVGTSLVELAYEGKSFPILNEAIKFQDKKPVEHYISVADFIFYKKLFVVTVILFFSVILTRLIFIKKTLNPGWIIGFGVLLISGIYYFNPAFKIFSFHGLYHLGIVYDIMHGNVPPENPLLGGEPLLWPWGHHYLVGSVSKIFNISPVLSFGLINMIAYSGTVYFIYKISGMLIKDSRANNFSVLTAVFCSAYINMAEYKLFIKYLGFAVEFRGTPLFHKMLIVNAAPVGFVSYIAFVYLLLLIFSDRKRWKPLLLLLLISVASTGFFYVQMLGGLLGSFTVFFIVKSLQCVKSKDRENIMKLLLSSITVVLGLLIIVPYIRSFSSGVGTKIAILRPRFVLEDVRSSVIVSLAMVIIISTNLKSLKKLNVNTKINLLSLLAGVLLSYICVRFPSSNDYKFLIQSAALLGIFGGISIFFQCTGKKRILILVLMLVLARPFFLYSRQQMKRNYWVATPIVSGDRILMQGEESQMYDWIVNDSSRDDMFIDNKLLVPCFGQRQLFIAIDEYRNNERVYVPGYIFSMEQIFTDTSGYSRELLDYRWRMVRKIYDPDVSLDDEELRELFSNTSNLLVIVRERNLQKKFDHEHFEKVFSSSENNFAIFKFKKNLI